MKKNNKIVISSFLSLTLFALLTAPSGFAFWPFDALFERGEVKAVTTEDRSVRGMPDYGSPIRSTSREIAALRAACRNIIDFDKPQPKKYENSTGRGNQAGGVSYNENAVQDSALDKSLTAEYTNIRRSLVTKCNEILSLTSRIDPILKKGENVPPRITKQATPPARIKEGLLQRFIKK